MHFSNSEKTLIATLYDVGTVVGSILLGILSDLMYGKRAPVCFVSLMIATVGHAFLIVMNENQKGGLFALIFFLGFFVGGVSNIVAGTVIADLGK